MRKAWGAGGVGFGSQQRVKGPGLGRRLRSRCLSSGQFYTQIIEAAPFQVFLSADQSTPKKLVDEGFAISNSAFTYAVGKIVLFSSNATLVGGDQTLRDAKFNKIAIADPTTAPYGTPTKPAT